MSAGKPQTKVEWKVAPEGNVERLRRLLAWLFELHDGDQDNANSGHA